MNEARSGLARRCFPAARRLKTAAQFKAVFDSGSPRLHAGTLTFIVAHQPQLGPRLGLIVAKRVAARAVTRNRLKRLIREAFREHQALLAGVDVIVMAKPGSGQAQGAQIRADLQRGWEKIIRWKKSLEASSAAIS